MPSRFAIYHPEGPGYLHVIRLGKGNEGIASLVRSVADGSFCVRKKAKTGSQVGEVGEINHPLIPKTYATYDYPKSMSTMQAFCNGGTLASVVDKASFDFASGSGGERLPEVVIWKILHQRLETLAYLHGRGIGRIDNHFSNCFLHFPHGAKVPDFYTGDLGHAQVIRPEDVTYIRADLDLIHDSVLYLFVRAPCDLEDVEDDPQCLVHEDKYRQPWSEELYECICELDAIKRHERDQQLAELPQFRARVLQNLRAAEEKDPNADITYVKPDVMEPGELNSYVADNIHQYARPFYSTKASAITAGLNLVPGPWRIAEVDAKTKQIINIDEEIHHPVPCSWLEYQYETAATYGGLTLFKESGEQFRIESLPRDEAHARRRRETAAALMRSFEMSYDERAAAKAAYQAERY